LQPTEGQLLLDGERLDGPDGRVGILLQKDHLFEWRTVLENAVLGLEIRGTSTAEARRHAQHLLQSYGLGGFENSYPHQLSGGMRQRVALIRTLATDPDILLLDEPFAALDEITRFRLNNDLLDLWRKLHKTIIFVTHSVFESVYLSQRVTVMTARPGRLASAFRIETAEPRGEEFRTSAEYAAYCREVSSALAPSYSGQRGA
jgi:NitT/TauT family transport system ATP-binding protein